MAEELTEEERELRRCGRLVAQFMMIGLRERLDYYLNIFQIRLKSVEVSYSGYD